MLDLSLTYDKFLMWATAMTRASDVFRDSNPDASVKAVKAWLNTQGVRDFEPVSLFSDHLPKVA